MTSINTDKDSRKASATAPGTNSAAIQPSSNSEELNVISDSPLTGMISNFAASPFVLDGKRFVSVEGFIQLIKYREGHPNRESLSGLAGSEARRAGSQANQENFARLDACTPVHVYWNSQEIPYRSAEHVQLIEAAIRAKFNQNPAAAEQLLATGQAKLCHDTGHLEHPYTSLPASVFCNILAIIRDDLARQI